METRNYWEENGHAVKYENYNSNDGFGRGGGGTGGTSGPCAGGARSEDEADYQAGAGYLKDEADYHAAGYLKKGKVSRQDPMSHRIIEKRRRDRMNSCLADLSRLIPLNYLKKGRGRVEKTEIIEMAIRHIKYLQDRADGEGGADKKQPTEHYKAGYQEAVTEAVRFLVEVQGYMPGDGLCVQMASHLHRHCEHITKGDVYIREKARPHLGSSVTSEAPSSSCSSHSNSHSHSHSYTMKSESGVIARVPAGPPVPAPQYDAHRYGTGSEPPFDQPYPMECDIAGRTGPAMPEELEGEGPRESEGPPPDARHKPEPTLRGVRKPEHGDDYLQNLHSYKFKNSIERRFSRSQDYEVHDMSLKSCAGHGKVHKRRRAAKPSPQPSTSTSNSGSTEDAVDTSPQDTSSESPPHRHYERPPPPHHLVPVFALNALGKYYVPVSIDYACLSRHLGAYDVLDARAATLAAPLHPVTIHVNFQPCLNYQVKREPAH